MNKLTNLTPYAVTIQVDDEGTHVIGIPSHGTARVAMVTKPAGTVDGTVDGIPVSEVEYGAADLPEGSGEGPFIVSTLFADAYRRQHGNDGAVLYTPDSGPSAIREDGKIVAVRGLILR